MRLSPSFDNSFTDLSPRPSIPLEPITLGNSSVKPIQTLPEVKLVPKNPLEIHQPIDVSSFFDKSAQPKSFQPTISHPQIKVKVINLPHPKPPEIKKVAPTPRVEVSKPIPEKKPQPVPIIPKPIPVPIPHIEVSKPPQIAKPIPVQLAPPSPPPVQKPPVEIKKPIFSKNEAAFKKVINSVAKPQPSPIKFTPPPRKPTPPPTPQAELEKAVFIQKQLHQKLDDIQLSISEELKKITPPPVIPPSPLVPKTQPTSGQPSFIQPVRTKDQSGQHPQSSSETLEHPAVHMAPPAIKPELLQPSSTISAVHFWDYFLIRVNPKLNPYKSVTRSRVILSVKAAGLILFVLGLVVTTQTVTQGFSLNVIFEAISTFTLSGILLFLGENLNLFFEPINPYKIREVV